jgi:REP element-mobilizing transposase RayT
LVVVGAAGLREYRNMRKSATIAKKTVVKKSNRGGARPGAGRPKSGSAGVSHAARPTFSSRSTVHIIIRLAAEVSALGVKKIGAYVQQAIDVGLADHKITIPQFSIRDGKLHLLVEAPDHQALSSAMQSLGVRLSRGLNRLTEREGRVFTDRYETKLLSTPAEVKTAKANLR